MKFISSMRRGPVNRDAHNLAKYSSNLEPGRYLMAGCAVPPDPHIVPLSIKFNIKCVVPLKKRQPKKINKLGEVEV
jgi:hypothetical protein